MEERLGWEVRDSNSADLLPVEHCERKAVVEACAVP